MAPCAIGDLGSRRRLPIRLNVGLPSHVVSECPTASIARSDPNDARTATFSIEVIANHLQPLLRTRTVCAMRRFVLDSNAIDPIADSSGAYEATRTAIDDGKIELLITHVNIDELAAIPDLQRRSFLLLLLCDLGTLVPTGAAVVDYSRLNFCRLNDDEEATEALRSGNIDHTRDALIAVTAEFEQCALVTNERRLTNRARDRGIEVLTTRDLLAEVGFQLS